MAIPGYQVRILCVANPHIIWAKKCDKDDTIMQIGLFGLFPESSIIEDKNTHNKWPSECVDYIKSEIYAAKEAYFLPLKQIERCSLFTDTRAIYGKLRLIKKDGSIIVLNQSLIDSKMAKNCLKTFTALMNSPNFVVYLSKKAINGIKINLFNHDCEINDSIILNNEESAPRCIYEKEIQQEKENCLNYIENNIADEAKKNNESNIRCLKYLKLQKEQVFNEMLDIAKSPATTTCYKTPELDHFKPTCSDVNPPKINESYTILDAKKNYKYPEDLKSNSRRKQFIPPKKNINSNNFRNNNCNRSRVVEKEIFKSNHSNIASVTNDVNRQTKPRQIAESDSNIKNNLQANYSLRNKFQSITTTNDHISVPSLKHALVDTFSDDDSTVHKNIESTKFESSKSTKEQETSDSSDPELAESDNEDIVAPQLSSPLTLCKLNNIKGFQNSISFKFPSDKSSLSSSINKSSSSSSLDKSSYKKSVESIASDSDNIEHVSNVFAPNPNEIIVENKFVENKTFIPCFNKLEKINNSIGDQITIPKLLLHSKHGKISTRWLHMRDTAFPKMIQKNIHYKAPMPSQTAIWPAAMRGHNIFAVGPPKSGKTAGVLLPLCSLISNAETFDSLPASHGPLALIICPNRQSALNIEHFCASLLAGIRNASGVDFKILRIDTNITDMNATTEMLAGCDILITTPFILKFMTCKFSALDLGRLAFLVFEDADLLDCNFAYETDTIYRMCRDVVKKRTNKDMKLQLFVNSMTWCNTMESLAKSVNNGVICISAFKECVIYSKSRLNVNFIKKSDKKRHVINFLNEECANVSRIIIVCINDDEVRSISDDLNKDLFRVLTANASMNLEQHNDVRNAWNAVNDWTRSIVLICCDFNLLYLDISNAHRLINFSLPDSLVAFGYRFSTLVEVYKNVWDDRADLNKSRIDMYIDETDSLRLPKIVDYIQRCGVELNDDIKNKVKIIGNYKEEEKAKQNVRLCDELLSYGNCFNYLNCQRRHSIFDQYDSLKDWIPMNGSIKFKILYVHSATCCSVRLFEHTSLDGKVTPIVQNYLSLACKMSTYFLDKNNLKSIVDLVPDTICAVQLNINQFQRCRIVKSNNKSIKILLIDEAREVEYEGQMLYDLPDEFKYEKCTALQIRLAGVMPKDKDISWCSKDAKLLDILSTAERNTFMRGRIVLGLADTLWLESTQLCQMLQSRKRIVVINTVKNELIKQGIAIDNCNHIPQLYELCKGSIQLPNYIPKPKYYDAKPELIDLQCNKVYDTLLASTISPGLFFLRLKKYDAKLDLLSTNIQSYISEYTPDAKSIKFDIGDYCVAQFTDDDYYRARIDDIICDESDTLLYNCFFVDFGDVLDVKPEFVYPITNKLIKQLPFQAIECNLFGIEPVAGNWSENSKDAFENMCYECKEDDFLKTLYIKFLSKDDSTWTKGNKFSIVMYDCSTVDMMSVLNHTFVLNNFALYRESEKDTLVNDDNSQILDILQNDLCFDGANVELAEPSDDPNADNIDYDKMNIVDFDVSESDSDDDEWDVCFDENMYLDTKKKLCPDDPPDIIDIFMSKGKLKQIVEVPNDFNDNNLNDIFEDAASDEKIKSK